MNIIYEKMKFLPTNGLALSVVTLIVAESVLYKVVGNGEAKVVMLLLPIVHFAYLYKNYKIVLNGGNLHFKSLFTKEKIIELNRISKIKIDDSKIEISIFGPIQRLHITYNGKTYTYDIYRFNVSEIKSTLDVLSMEIGFEFIK